MSNLKLQAQGLLLVLSAPSGGGKTSLSRALTEIDHNICRSISMTTRRPRGEEQEGESYFFVDRGTFSGMLLAGEILEHTEIYGNMYGTPRSEIEEFLDEGKDVVFDIDWRGASSLKHAMPEQIVTIFILPPSMEELAKRLSGRAEDSAMAMAKRIGEATKEILHAKNYDYIVVNDNFDKALKQIHTILQAERLKRERLGGLEQYLNNLKTESF